jgi:hypothetical protein
MLQEALKVNKGDDYGMSVVAMLELRAPQGSELCAAADGTQLNCREEREVADLPGLVPTASDPIADMARMGDGCCYRIGFD